MIPQFGWEATPLTRPDASGRPLPQGERAVTADDPPLYSLGGEGSG